MNIVYKYK